MKKGLNIFLIITVIVIYAKAFWPTESSDNLENIPESQHFEVLKNSRSSLAYPKLELHFVDPFLKTGHSSHHPKPRIKNNDKKKIPKKQQNLPHNVPQNLKYLGRIHNPSTGISKGLIQYKTKEILIELNDSIAGYIIHKIEKNHIELKMNDHHVNIEKK